MPAYSRFQPLSQSVTQKAPSELKLKSNTCSNPWGLQQLNTSLNLSSSSVKL